MTGYNCDKCDREFESKDALVMHNKSKHSELHKEPMFSNKQKKKIRNYGIIFLIVLVIGGFLYWKLVPPKDAPIIEVMPNTYNFGTVSQAKGTVSAEMTISNTGAGDLILNNIDTSCGCTSASVIYKGVEGPRFSMSMHGTNPKNWRQVIPPGESAILKVYYDPNVHKDMRGAVTRSVTIYSNTLRNSMKEVRITAYQTD